MNMYKWVVGYMGVWCLVFHGHMMVAEKELRVNGANVNSKSDMSFQCIHFLSIIKLGLSLCLKYWIWFIKLLLL